MNLFFGSAIKVPKLKSRAFPWNFKSGIKRKLRKSVDSLILWSFLGKYVLCGCGGSWIGFGVFVCEDGGPSLFYAFKFKPPNSNLMLFTMYFWVPFYYYQMGYINVLKTYQKWNWIIKFFLSSCTFVGNEFFGTIASTQRVPSFTARTKLVINVEVLEKLISEFFECFQSIISLWCVYIIWQVSR